MINFEEEDFELDEALLDDVLPSRTPHSSRDVQPASEHANTVLRDTLNCRPLSAAEHAEEDDAGLGCTPDSVSVSQVFGLRGAPAPHRAPRLGHPTVKTQPKATANWENVRTGDSRSPVSVQKNRPSAPLVAGKRNHTEPPPADPFEADPFAGDDDILDSVLLDAFESIGNVYSKRNDNDAPVNRVRAEAARNSSKRGAVYTHARVNGSNVPQDGHLGSDILGACDKMAAESSRSPDCASDNPNSSRDRAFCMSSTKPHPTRSAANPRLPAMDTTPLPSFISGDSPPSTIRGSRDSPVDPRSRSGPTRSETATPGSCANTRRRSSGSSVKRRFPGPAGILPNTGSVLTLAHEISLTEEEDAEREDAEDHRMSDVPSQTQSVLSQPDPCTFQLAPWRCVLAELGLSRDQPDSVLSRINISAVRRAAANNSLRKVPLLVVVLLSLDASTDLSYSAKFRDPTGEMEGTVAKDAFDACGGVLRPGAVLVLREVAVWRESARRLYLSVTRRSLLMLAAETDPGTDMSSVVKLSEFSPAELLSARLVEERPSVPVLHESPPPSPPRPQLYSTAAPPAPPQGSRGGRWRGRSSWRGRGRGLSRITGHTPGAGRGVSYTRPTASPSRGASAPNSAPRDPSTPTLFGAGRMNATSAPGAVSMGQYSGAGDGTKRTFSATCAASPALRPAASRTSSASAGSVVAGTAGPVSDLDDMFDDADDALFGGL